MNAGEREHQFRDLLAQHQGILFKVTRAYCRNPDDGEDLAQETVLQLWRSFGRYDDRLRFSTWMYRIALNVAISFFRRERTRERYIVADEERLLEVAGEPDTESEEIAELYAMIQALEPLNRALVLLYLDGNSHREIAEVLGISESNVGTRLSRLKDRMKAQVESAG